MHDYATHQVSFNYLQGSLTRKRQQLSPYTTHKNPHFPKFQESPYRKQKRHKMLFILTSFNLFGNIFVHLQHEFLNYPKTLFPELVL